MRKSKNIHKSNKVHQSKKKITKRLNFRSRKLQVFVVVVVIAIAGASYLLFVNAQSNNCQKQDGVDICDVNEVSGPDDTILSIGPEAQTLNAQNPSAWPLYYPTAIFRAPKDPYPGTVPVHRVINVGASWHDWVIDRQKNDKEAKYGALHYEGVAFYAWEHQVPGTIPIYRLTMGGSASKAFFVSDKAWVDKLLAQDANNPDGWKMGTTMEAVAFYAYPPNYSVPGTSNPGDCSKPENFVKDICKGAAGNLDKEIKNGNVSSSNTCPTTVDAYVKAIFPQQFSAECQQKWNDYMKDCSIKENFISDRCKIPREALQKAQAEKEKQKAQTSIGLQKGVNVNKHTKLIKQLQKQKSHTNVGQNNQANVGNSDLQVDLALLAKSFGSGFFTMGGAKNNYKKIVKGDCEIEIVTLLPKSSGLGFEIVQNIASLITDGSWNKADEQSTKKSIKNITSEQCVKEQKKQEKNPVPYQRRVGARLKKQRYEYVKE